MPIVEQSINHFNFSSTPENHLDFDRKNVFAFSSTKMGVLSESELQCFAVCDAVNFVSGMAESRWPREHRHKTQGVG